MPPNGTKNLKPVRSKEEAKARGAKGGKKSGETRRKQKSMREAAKILLSLKPKDEEIRNNLQELGLEDDEQTNQLAVLASVMTSAINGNIGAAAFLRDTLGESPSLMNIEVNQETTVKNPVNVYAVELPSNGREIDTPKSKPKAKIKKTDKSKKD